MLHSLLSIEDYTALGLDIIHVADFFELLLRFILNLTIVVTIVRGMYYPLARRKDYLVHLYTRQFGCFPALYPP